MGTDLTLDFIASRCGSLARHWEHVENDILGHPFPLSDGTSRETFLDYLEQYQTAYQSARTARNSLVMALFLRDKRKESLAWVIPNFRAALRYQLSGTSFAGSIPLQPRKVDTETVFLRAYDKLAHLWEQVNAEPAQGQFTPPLTLAGGMTLQGLRDEIAALREEYLAVKQAELDLKLARAQRDDAYRALRTRMRLLREALAAHLGPDHYMVAATPRIAAPRKPGPKRKKKEVAGEGE